MNIPDNHNLKNGNGTAAVSPVPTIAVLVLIWVVSAVLLTISILTQRDFTILKEGDSAPFSTWALTDFKYVDREKTNQEKEAARRQKPFYFRIDNKISQKIIGDFERFVHLSSLRGEMESYKQKYHTLGGNEIYTVIGKLKNFSEWFKLIKNKEQLDLLTKNFHHTVNLGIIGKHSNQNVLVITPDGKELNGFTPPTAEAAATQALAAVRCSPALKSELKYVIIRIIGNGNLVLDRDLTHSVREAAAAEVPDSYKECRRGEMLVSKGEIITEEIVHKIKAEKDALPQNFGMAAFYYRLGVTFLLLLVASLFLYSTYPIFFQNIHHIMLAGAVIIFCLAANYGAIFLFFHIFKVGYVSDYQLLFALLPISLCAALSTAFLGNRAAIFCVLLVASISAMMAFPDRSFEQALRWFFIGVMVALSVRNVRNYRSFFLRVLIFGAFSTALINSDMLFNAGRQLIAESAFIIFANTFICAVTSLLMVFAFELIFNADTNMSLMMLCDHSHSLLDELKRKAPGTMFHSMNVATLAEDAASAIRVNPLKAKAGALFHDIGKLGNPHYFVENNVDSPAEHDKLPPRQSCSIIRDHVQNGLLLSRKYRLSRFIRRAIVSHHGDDLVSFFYRKAVEFHKQNPDSPPVNEADYHYSGETPDEKELTIISLADACEAACRSLASQSEESIRDMVEKIFMHRFKQGQLRNSKLTLEELDTVKSCFIKDLVNFNHGRIAYNKEKHNDQAEQPVVLPEQKSSEKK